MIRHIMVAAAATLLAPAAQVGLAADTVPAIARIRRAAHAAMAPDLRDAEARAGAEEAQSHTVSTLSWFVEPGVSNGTPAVNTTRSPGRA